MNFLTYLSKYTSAKMVYIQKRRANRIQGMDLSLVEHSLKKLEVEPAAETMTGSGVEHKIKAKKVKHASLEKVLTEIGINTGTKVKAKKLTPIDTTVLLRSTE